MAGSPGRSGGSRTGAGRPKKSEQFKAQISRVNRKIAKGLDGYLEQMEALALGTAEYEERFYEAACTILIEADEAILDEAGEPTGKWRRVKRLAFPNAEPDEMILVRKKVVCPAPDVRALIYLFNRLIGAPPIEDEEEADEQAPDTLPEALESGIAKIYGVSETEGDKSAGDGPST